MTLALLLTAALHTPQAPQAPTSRDLSVPTEWRTSSAPRFVSRPNAAPLLTWVEEDEARAQLRWAELGDSGFGPAHTIAEGTDWLVNWADVPAVAVGEGGAMVATWLVRSGEDGYGVVLSASPDGAHWSEPLPLHDSQAGPEHGFVSLAALAGTPARFDAVWLDSRAMAKGEDAHGRGAMQLLARRITVSTDGPALGPERVLDDRTCDCCSTSAVPDGAGGLLVAYRDRTRDEVRDISVLHVTAEQEPTRLDPRADHWTIPGCPVNGPALARTGEELGLAWFTMDRGLTGTARPKPLVRAAFGTIAAGFEPPRRVDLGAPIGRLATTFDGTGRLLVAWLEDGARSSDGSRTPARWLLAELGTRTDPAGTREPRVLREADPSRRSGFPSLTWDPAGERVLFACTDVREDGSTEVRVVVP